MHSRAKHLKNLNCVKLPDSVKTPREAPKKLHLGIPDSLSVKFHKDQTDKIESRQRKLTSQIDSLTKIPNPDKKLLETLSIKRKRLDSLRSPPIINGFISTGQASKQKVDKTLLGIKGGVNEKLGLFSENGAIVPGPVNLSQQGPSTSMPQSSGGISLPGATMPSANIPDVAVPDAKGVTVPSMPALKTSVPEIGTVTGELGQVNGTIKEAAGYKKDIKAITSGNLDSLDAESVEKRVGQLDFVGDADDQPLDGAQQAAMIKKWQSEGTARLTENRAGINLKTV